jgi:nicotinamidase-related amidase
MSGWIRRVTVVAAAALAAGVLLTPSVLAQASPPEPPGLPDFSPVALDPATTALLVLDINSAVCPPRPACLASLPAIARLLGRARAAGVFVGYSSTAGADILPDVTPRDGDPVVTSRAHKFFNTNLDQILKDHGIQTVLLVGSAANGAVLYTSFGANERGYTVAVAVDGISAGQDFDTYLAEYQVLNQPGFNNPTNDPLKPNAATLPRGDLVSFGSASK